MLKRTRIIVGAPVAIVVLVVVVVAVYLLTRDDAPEAVDLETAVARIEAAETADGDSDTPPAGEPADPDTPSTGISADDTTDTGTTSSAGSEGTTYAGTAETASGDAAAEAGTGDSGTEAPTEDRTVDAPAGLAGVWDVQVAENAGDLQGEPTVSFAGFRVDEVLGGGIGDFTAVGRTADVSGSVKLTDTALVAAAVEVTMSTLRTDNGSRDNQVRRALNTSEFPMAVFVLVEPVELPAAMAEGAAISGSALGDLTIKGVTNRATFDLQAQLVGDTIVAVGSSDVVFSDYGVTAPTAPIVVSVEDHGIMEFQLILTR